MDIGVCVFCSIRFEKKGKNYSRRHVTTKIQLGRTVDDVLERYGILCTGEGFVCNQCFSLLKKAVALESVVEELENRRSQPMKRKSYSMTLTPSKVSKTNVGTSPIATSVTSASNSNSKQSSQNGCEAEAISAIQMREGFVCNQCIGLVKKAGALESAEEEFENRTSVASTPKQSSQKGWKAEAISAIQKSNFTGALKRLMKSRSFRHAFVRFVTAEVRRETQGYAKGSGKRLGSEVTPETMAAFSWNSITNELKSNLPVLHASLTGALTSNINVTAKLDSSVNGCGKALPVMGMAFAQLIYNRFPTKFNFVQELCALEMWNSGCSQKLFQHFQRLGICKGVKGLKGSLDRFRKDFDKEKTECPTDAPAHVAPSPAVTLFDGDLHALGERDEEEGSDEAMVSDSTSTTTAESSSEEETASSISVSDAEEEVVQEEPS